MKDLEHYYKIQDLKDFINNLLSVYVTYTDGNIIVSITKTNCDFFPRKGRLFYTKNDIPVVSGYWMDFNENDEISNISDIEYEALFILDRALIECKRQFKYPLDKQYEQYYIEQY